MTNQTPPMPPEIQKQMKKVGLKISFMMALMMSFALSLTGNLTAEHPPEMPMIAIIIGFLEGFVIVELIEDEDILGGILNGIYRQLHEMWLLFTFQRDLKTAAVLGLELSRIVREDLVIAGDLLARSLEMEPQVQYQVMVDAVRLEETFEHPAAYYCLVCIDCRIDKDYRADIVIEQL